MSIVIIGHILRLTIVMMMIKIDDYADGVACPDNQFRCTDGQCISACKRCDEHNDCRDNSDEEDCCKISLLALLSSCFYSTHVIK